MASSTKPISQEEEEEEAEELSHPHDGSDAKRTSLGNPKHNSTFNPEVRRKEFRKYLDKSGLMDSLTRVLVQLYEEKDQPTDIVEYIYDNLSGGTPIKMELSALLAEKAALTAQVAEIEKANDLLEAQLETAKEWKGEADHEGLFEEEGEAEEEEEEEEEKQE